MEIYLMQHGPNLPKDQDPDEGLSPQGREAVQACARALHEMGLVFDFIIASPKLRARQTAELAARATGFDPERIAISAKIKAMADPAESLAALSDLVSGKRALIAGHMPNLTRVASVLLAGSGELQVTFERGSVCRIDAERFQAGAGSLRWFMLPGQLEKIASQ